MEEQLAEAARAIGEAIQANWPSLVRYGGPPVFSFLRKKIAERVEGAPPETVASVAQHSGIAARYIAAEVDRVIAKGVISEEDAVRRMVDPEFLLTLTALLGDAGEKSEDFWLRQVGTIAGALLTSTPQSRKSLVLKTASESLAGLNARQLRALAFMCILGFNDISVVGPDASSPAEYIEKFDTLLAPFDEVPIDVIDIRIFESLNLATMLQHSRASSRLLEQIPGLPQVDPPVEMTGRIRRASMLWNGNPLDGKPGLHAAQLTATGYLLGRIAQASLIGGTPTLSNEWDEPPA